MGMDGNADEQQTADDEMLPSSDTLLDELNFEAESMFLTRRQASVLALREEGFDQGTIAAELSCSRANVSNIERSARENIEKARETLVFAEILTAPVREELPEGLPLHEVPNHVYAACDEAEVKVQYGAPELIRKIVETSPASEEQGTLVEQLVLKVTAEGEIHIYKS